MTITYKECFFAPSEMLCEELEKGTLYTRDDLKMEKIKSPVELYNCVMQENVYLRKEDCL